MNILVTGSSYGIGRAVAEMFLKTGDNVIGISRKPGTITNPRYTHVCADLSRKADIEKLVDNISGRIDVLINNAGTAIARAGLEWSEEIFQKIFNLNFIAPITLLEAGRQNLAENAVIINISSISDRIYGPGFALYSASKAALNAYFGTLSLEYPSWKIISLLPSCVDTPLLRGPHPDQKNFYENNNVDFSSLLTTNDIARCIAVVIENKENIPSGSRVIVINDDLKDDAKNPENLFVWNATGQSLDRIRKNEIA